MRTSRNEDSSVKRVRKLDKIAMQTAHYAFKMNDLLKKRSNSNSANNLPPNERQYSYLSPGRSFNVDHHCQNMHNLSMNQINNPEITREYDKPVNAHSPYQANSTQKNIKIRKIYNRYQKSLLPETNNIYNDNSMFQMTAAKSPTATAHSFHTGKQFDNHIRNLLNSTQEQIDESERQMSQYLKRREQKHRSYIAQHLTPIQIVKSKTDACGNTSDSRLSDPPQQNNSAKIGIQTQTNNPQPPSFQNQWTQYQSSKKSFSGEEDSTLFEKLQQERRQLDEQNRQVLEYFEGIKQWFKDQQIIFEEEFSRLQNNQVQSEFIEDKLNEKKSGYKFVFTELTKKSEKYDQAKQKVKMYEGEINLLKQENEYLNIQNQKLQQQINEFKAENEKLKNATNSLFDELKHRSLPELLTITDDFKLINPMKLKRNEQIKSLDDLKLTKYNIKRFCSQFISALPSKKEEKFSQEKIMKNKELLILSKYFKQFGIRLIISQSHSNILSLPEFSTDYSNLAIFNLLIPDKAYLLQNVTPHSKSSMKNTIKSKSTILLSSRKEKDERKDSSTMDWKEFKKYLIKQLSQAIQVDKKNFIIVKSYKNQNDLCINFVISQVYSNDIMIPFIKYFTEQALQPTLGHNVAMSQIKLAPVFLLNEHDITLENDLQFLSLKNPKRKHTNNHGYTSVYFSLNEEDDEWLGQKDTATAYFNVLSPPDSQKFLTLHSSQSGIYVTEQIQIEQWGKSIQPIRYENEHYIMTFQCKVRQEGLIMTNNEHYLVKNPADIRPHKILMKKVQKGKDLKLIDDYNDSTIDMNVNGNIIDNDIISQGQLTQYHQPNYSVGYIEQTDLFQDINNL